MTSLIADPTLNFTRLQAGSTDRRVAFGLRARRAALGRLQTMVQDHKGEIASAIAADLGKPPAEVDMAEILPVLAEIAHARRHLRRWMRPRGA